MRYGARPPLALDRLRRLPDGRIAYRIKKLRDGRAKHRVMTPLEFLARLAAIVPPPRYPLLRYAGVLGPRSAWRRDVAPRAPQSKPCNARPAEQAPKIQRELRVAPCPKPNVAEPAAGGTPKEEAQARPLPPTSAAMRNALPQEGQLLAPNVLSVKHWSRLLEGSLYAASPRVDWASLLRRTFEVDVLKCATCGGRLRVLGEVTEPTMVSLVLQSLGMPTDTPPVARARDPTESLGEHADE